MKLLHCIASVNPAGGGPIEGIMQRARCMAAAGGGSYWNHYLRWWSEEAKGGVRKHST